MCSVLSALDGVLLSAELAVCAQLWHVVAHVVDGVCVVRCGTCGCVLCVVVRCVWHMLLRVVCCGQSVQWRP